MGKYKTILQVVGLSMMLFRQDLLFVPIYEIGLVLTLLAAALTLWSMASYLRAAWPDLWGLATLDSNALLLTIRRLTGGSRAGIAQLVERNLAKVEVASSSLVSRSSFPANPGTPSRGFCYIGTSLG